MPASKDRQETSPRHSLEAILFADIAGFTALMQKDEAVASTLLHRFQKEIDEKVAAHDGRIVNFYGDGALCIFQTPLEAVHCAMDLQTNFKEAPSVPVRIGMHIGTVVIDDDQVYGDSVNLASRIQSMGIAGAVLFSESIRKDIKNHPEFEVISLGQFEFKNVEEPMEVFALVNEGLTIPKPKDLQGKSKGTQVPFYASFLVGSRKWFALAGVLVLLLAGWFGIYLTKTNGTVVMAVPEENSIAVLPFINISGNPDQEYFSDGISEEIINSLTQINSLKVAARTSSFSFKDTKTDLPTIGRKLNVNMVLEGSVRRSNDHIRVTVQLINVADGFHIWSEEYDTEIGDLFAVQDDISSRIREKLNITLSGGQVKKTDARPTGNMEAYEMFLKGNYFINQRVNGVEKALHYYTRAIELDSAFTRAYVQLSYTYYWLAAFDFLPPGQSFPQARKYANKALALEKDLPDAYEALAWIYLMYDWNWDAAWIQFQKLTPPGSSPAPRFFPAWYRAQLYGDFDYAIEVTQMLVDRDPLSIWWLTNLAHLNLLDRRFTEARDILKKVQELQPFYSEGIRYLGVSYFYEGNFDQAIRYLREAVELSEGKGSSLFYLICALAASGQAEEAEQLYAVWSASSTLIISWKKAIISAYLNNMDKAFQFMEQSVANRDFWLISLQIDPIWDILRPDPRFEVLVSRLNFPRKE